MKTALIVIPARNEEASLARFLPRLTTTTRGLSTDYHVLVVDDGSTDHTVKLAMDMGCRVLRNKENCGVGMSLRKGYEMALAENFYYVITMDADGQHDERFLPGIFDEFFEGTDIVIGSRYHPKSERRGVPLDRDLLNIAVAAQIRTVTGWEITDPLSGFWGMNQMCVKLALQLGRQERYGIHLEHLIKFWYLADPRPTIKEFPHPAIYRNGEESLLTRDYAPTNMESRIERFGTHAHHIVEALQDVIREIGEEPVYREIQQRRWRWL